MRVHYERSARYSESKGHFGGYDDQPFAFQLEIVKMENTVEFDVLRVLSGLDCVSISGISRDELVALRNTINAHLGERSQTDSEEDR
jgi:hypothetical protein